MRKPMSPADLPPATPVFPLSGALLLPQTNRPLNIFEPRYIALVDAALAGDRLITLAQPKSTSEESPKGKAPLNEIGCVGRLVHFEETDDDRYLIVLEGLCRVRLTREITEQTEYRRFLVDAEGFEGDFAGATGENAVDRERFLDIMRAYADFAGLEIDWEEVEQTGTADLVNLCSMLSPYGAAEKQLLLEAPTLSARAETLIALAEVEMARSRAGHVLQ